MQDKTGNKELELGMVETPEPWCLDADYDSWPSDWRRRYLGEYLARGINFNNGVRLKELRSAEIEAYLAIA